MRGKNHLYYLIHSLSKSEKRYFTIDAKRSGHKESRYLELFQFINKQSEYDELALKKKFGKKLADDKTRLYEALLSSLRDYQSSKSYKTRIKELLTDAKILFERKLYEQCENRLSEAKSLAVELQDHLAVLEINLRQRQLIKEYQHKDYAEQVEQLIEEKEHHLKIVEEEFWLHDNYDRLSVDVVRYHDKLSQESIDELSDKYRPILEFDNTDKSFFSRWRHFRALALYYRLTGNKEGEFRGFGSAAGLWKDYPVILAENYFFYLGDMFNVLSLTSRDTNKFEDLPSLIHTLEEEQEKKISQQAQELLFQGITNYKLLYYLNANQPITKSELLKIEDGLNYFKISPAIGFGILFNCTLILFLDDRFEECLVWLKKIWHLHKKTKSLREDILGLSQILHLLTIYKIRNIETVENSIRSGKRFFKTQSGDKAQKQLYLLLSKAILKSYEAFSHRELLDTFQELKTTVKGMKKDLPGGIDEICALWTESVIQQKPISQLRVAAK